MLRVLLLLLHGLGIKNRKRATDRGKKNNNILPNTIVHAAGANSSWLFLAWDRYAETAGRRDRRSLDILPCPPHACDRFRQTRTQRCVNCFDARWCHYRGPYCTAASPHGLWLNYFAVLPDVRLCDVRRTLCNNDMHNILFAEHLYAKQSARD